MTVVAFNGDVSKDQLKNYADVICFSQVGLSDAEISARLSVPEYTIAAWVANWIDMETRAMYA